MEGSHGDEEGRVRQGSVPGGIRDGLVGLAAEGAPLGEAGTASGGLAEDGGAGTAKDDGLGVGEDGGDVEAAGALDVHEVGVGALHKALELVSLLLVLDGGVKEIDGELEWRGEG
jgi:hypothetical protein